MKDSLKRLGIKRGSAIALIIAYAVVPLTFLKGNPTGAIWTHDHASRYIRLNSINLDNHKNLSSDYISSVKTGLEMDNKIQDKRMQLMLLELRMDNISKSTYSDSEKEAKNRKIEKRIDRLYDQLDRDGIRREEIQSTTKDLMIAYRR